MYSAKQPTTGNGLGFRIRFRSGFEGQIEALGHIFTVFVPVPWKGVPNSPPCLDTWLVSAGIYSRVTVAKQSMLFIVAVITSNIVDLNAHKQCLERGGPFKNI